MFVVVGACSGRACSSPLRPVDDVLLGSDQRPDDPDDPGDPGDDVQHPVSERRDFATWRGLVRRRNRGAWSRQRGPSRSSRSPTTHPPDPVLDPGVLPVPQIQTGQLAGDDPRRGVGDEPVIRCPSTSRTVNCAPGCARSSAGSPLSPLTTRTVAAQRFSTVRPAEVTSHGAVSSANPVPRLGRIASTQTSSTAQDPQIARQRHPKLVKRRTLGCRHLPMSLFAAFPA
jgi:hypothetical protein